MSRKLQQMRQASAAHIGEAQAAVHETGEQLCNHLGQVKEEYKRVSDVSHNAPAIIENLDKQFKQKTQLQDSDIKFLFICTGLQILRQSLLPTIFAKGKRLTAIEGDKLMRKALSPITPKSWEEVLFSSVPYDAYGAPELDTGLSGTTHRYRTLGHDPVLGWFFGPANILTDSVTKSDIITTYAVQHMRIIGPYLPAGTLSMLGQAARTIQDQPIMLPVALARQAIHFGSDYFTGQGLPLPFLGTLAPEAAHRFMNSSMGKNTAHLDLLNVSISAGLAALINQIIYCIHKMLYNERRDGPQSLYEVRTRKILTYSNAMSTGCNVLYVAVSGQVAKLDVGGILETIHRLISDYSFIQQIKRDFLKDEIYKMVVGDQYDFMEEI